MSQYQSRVFGQYTLIEKIASGGMAEIWLATTRGFGGFEKSLVIKRLHPHYSDDHQFVKMLVDEAKITVQLQHSNIVQIFDLGRVGGQYYIAMEYVKGHDLFAVLRELHQTDLQMPVEAAAYIAAQSCHGLHYAHCMRDAQTGQPLEIVHRDISPQNILLSWAGEVKIADFGIVKAAQRSTHTEAGIIKGKFYYMSPEQSLGIDIDWRSDIFSAGIVLFETLTASPMYDDTTSTTLMEKVQRGTTKRPSEYRDDIPPELERICIKALETDRHQRYQSALEMGRDLSNFLVTRDRSFTKVDLGEFLQSLFSEGTATDPEMPAGPSAETAQHDFGLRSGDVGSHETNLDRPAPAQAPPPIPAAAQIAPLAHVQMIAPVLDDTPTRTTPARVAPDLPTQPVPLHLEPTLSPVAVPGIVLDMDPTIRGAKDMVSEEPVNNDARTARLSKAEIARVNAAMLAARSGSHPAPVAPEPAVAPEPGGAPKPQPKAERPQKPRISNMTRARQPSTGPIRTISSPVLTPLPVREERQQRQKQLMRRERSLRSALAVVAVLILAVAAAIVWVLINPVKAPPETRTTPTPQEQAQSALPAVSTDTPPDTPTAGRTRKAAQPAVARLIITLPPGVEDYRLHVNGELHETPADGELILPPGSHDIRARLNPSGKETPTYRVVLRPGATERLTL